MLVAHHIIYAEVPVSNGNAINRCDVDVTGKGRIPGECKESEMVHWLKMFLLV